LRKTGIPAVSEMALAMCAGMRYPFQEDKMLTQKDSLFTVPRLTPKTRA
jgi:hypothetical protein